MLRYKKEATANELIDSLYWEDLYELGIQDRAALGWRYYVHLNKLFALLERDGEILFTGKEKLGESGRMEKVWRYKKTSLNITKGKK